MVTMEYKCRRCGEVYVTNQIMNKHEANIVLLKTITGRDLGEKYELFPGMLGIHHACEGGMGVSDFIGYSEKQERD